MGSQQKVLLVVYRSLIRFILEYGALALDSMNNTKKKLDTVQAEALRIACGAARGTSTAAIQVVTGEPPLQLRRLQLQLQYAVKVKSQKKPPASVVLQPHWLNKSRHFDENTNPIYEKVSAFIADMDIIECQNTLSTSDHPWRRKQCKVEISVSEAVTKTFRR